MTVVVVILAITCGFLLAIVLFRIHKEAYGLKSKEPVERVIKETVIQSRSFHESFFDMVKDVARHNTGFTEMRFEYKEPGKQVFTLKCKHCGMTNRLKSRDTGNARCGKCGLPMSSASIGKN